MTYRKFTEVKKVRNEKFTEKLIEMLYIKGFVDMHKAT